MQYTVTTPVQGFTGTCVGVVFQNGTGTVSDDSDEGRAALAYFGRHAYGVAPVEQAAPAPAPAAAPSAPDAPAAKATAAKKGATA